MPYEKSSFVVWALGDAKRKNMQCCRVQKYLMGAQNNFIFYPYKSVSLIID